MTTRPESARRALTRMALAAAVAFPLVAGCTNPFAPRIAPIRGVSSPPPVPTTPAKAVELFAWCWRNRAYNEYTEIFTYDFKFLSAEQDSSGQQGSGLTLNREEELETAKHLFVEGSANEPPASSIDITIDGALLDLASSIRGQNPKWHREIVTSVYLVIRTPTQDFNVSGKARYWMVRGDSALIPPELQPRFRPDSTRWWIERWNDETGGTTRAVRPREEGLAARLPFELTDVRVERVPPAARTPLRADGATALTMSWSRIKLAYLGRR